MATNTPQATTFAPAIGKEQLREFMKELREYNAGKARTTARIRASESWWKLRNDAEEGKDSATMGEVGFHSKSGWLHNVITSKHADAMEAYPEPNILPREEQDKAEAQILSAIIPCILEQNDFENTYSDANWQKAKTGTGVYKVVWDAGKLNGLGDISITRVNLMNVYWEPGKDDIQQSRMFFHTELVDKDALESQYPELHNQLNGQSFVSSKFLYDETMKTDNKVTVIEVYYHKIVGGKNTLQYCKFVDDHVLFATENDPEMAARGLYDHGKYPYRFDPLFPIEGSPCGYGYVDLCRSPQLTIDLMNTAFVKNAQVGAVPRYFVRQDGAVNKEEFLDLTKALVTVNGNLGEDSLRQIPFQTLDDVYVSYLDRVIQELRETSGNTETSTGNVSSGVTAASAIAALQEASGKGSRDSNKASYRVYRDIVDMCIELIRQFYTAPRTFRITGNMGAEQYIQYTNAHLIAQEQGSSFDMDMGMRLPVFDIKVSAQKKNAYTKMSQNEMAIQFFQLGFFNPQNVDQALMCMDMMEFDGKDAIMQKIARNGTMFEKLVNYMQLALTLAAKAAPEMVQGLSQDIMMTVGGKMPEPASAGAQVQQDNVTGAGKEHPYVENARKKANESSQPDGAAVMKGV